MNSDNARLIVAEDDVITRTSMTAYLKAEGYEVQKTADGLEALGLIRENPPDLVISDLNMPVMDGMELLKVLAVEYPDIPVIIVSGVGTMTNVIEALRVGASDYIQKPIEDMGLLKHSIDIALSHLKLKIENKSYQEDLEWLVERRTSEIFEKNLELKKMVEERRKTEAQLLQAQKLESVGQLAAGIAHEINTPTQFVSSNLDFLDESFKDVIELVSTLDTVRKRVQTDEVNAEFLVEAEELIEELDWEYLAEEIPKALDQSREGVKRISTIVKAMKDFSHPGSKDMGDVDLNRIITTTVVVARNEWKYVADLETDLDSSLQPTRCLSDEVGQAILNMIVNAAHAIEDKLGKTPDDGKGKITISTKQLEAHVEIRITDSGTGIPEHARHRIFDPFYTTKKVGKGTGQGLAIAHTVITNKHGGTLTFETEDDVGTTFIITLPHH